MESNSVTNLISKEHCADISKKEDCTENKCTETSNGCAEAPHSGATDEEVANSLQNNRLTEQLAKNDTAEAEAVDGVPFEQPTVISPLAVFDPNTMDEAQKHYTTQFIGKFLELEQMIAMHPSSSSEGSYTRRCFSVAMQYLEGARDQIMRGICLQNFKMQGSK